MLNRIPTTYPPLSMMLDDIGNPSSQQLARALRVPIDLVETWREDDQAPHLVMVSLFWLTRWGRDAVDCEATNLVRVYHGLARARELEAGRLRDELARLCVLGDFGAANAPTLTEYAPRLRLVSWQ
jgi:hypothetical protein